MSTQYDLDDLARSIEHNIRSELHTLMPGKISQYYPETQTADVKLMLMRVTWSDEDAEDGTPAGHKVYTQYPMLPNIPVKFPGGSGFATTYPLAAGDACDVFFAEGSLADYLATGGISQQQDVGRHKLGYAVCYPVIDPHDTITDTDVHANDRMVIGQMGGDPQVQITGSNVILGKGATDFAALASKVDAAITFMIGIYNAHTHVSAAPGSPTAVPVALMSPAPTSVAATITKVK